MTYHLLDTIWKEYWREDSKQLRKQLRFGQYFFNQTDIETGNSYYEENDFKAYMMLMNYIYTK